MNPYETPQNQPPKRGYSGKLVFFVGTGMLLLGLFVGFAIGGVLVIRADNQAIQSEIN